MQGEIIQREQWQAFVKEFNRRNRLRATRVEVLGDVGAQEAVAWLPLNGISVEMKGKDAPRVELSLGGVSGKDRPHLTRVITRARNIMRKLSVDGIEEALLIEDRDGTKTLVRFDSPPEMQAAA